ncbi:MAG: hypothetical protein CMJ25_21735 [Phycisphaerae bacterium]|nr:hypothetical protein [Phycisphaerae bacterium]
MFNRDNINNIDPAAKFESKMLCNFGGGGTTRDDVGGDLDAFGGAGADVGYQGSGYGTFDGGGSNEYSAPPSDEGRANMAAAVVAKAAKEAAEMREAEKLLAGVKDLEQRQAADAIMGMPAYMNAISQLNLSNIANQIAQGGRPVYNNAGQIMGVMGKGLFGGTVYSGRPDFDPNRTEEGGDQPDRPRYPYPYPMTAEEEAEEEYQSSIPTDYVRPENGFYPETGAYARMGLLDTMPENLLEFMPDFAEQNRAFRMGSATRPEYFQDPYDLRGYTLLG